MSDPHNERTTPVVWCHDVMAQGVTLLEREVYTEAEAARLLRVAQGTLHYWLEGGQRRSKYYQPVVRPEPTGDRIVTWGEFVESALLRSYRRDFKIPMVELRLFIQTLRQETGAPYPLAHHRPWVVDRRLLFHAQEEADLPTSFWLVSNNQGMLTDVGEHFAQRVEWDGEVAGAIRPSDDPGSPVRINPRIRFGAPAIRGTSTAALADQVEAGSSIEDVANDFDLTPAEVQWAVAYESKGAKVA